MAVIQSGVSSDQLTVDPTSKAARVSIYDTSGNVISTIDRSAVTPGSQGGLLNAGVDGKIARLIRVGSDGALRVGDSDLLFYDSIEGGAVDTNKWVQNTTTMTITQSAATGTLFNASGSTASTVGAIHTSHNKFKRGMRMPLMFRSRQRHTAHFTNNLIELGLADTTAITSAGFPNGACWRKDGTGQYVPVISVGGSEILGTPISNATFVASVPTTDYATFEVIIHDDRAHFAIYTQNGVLVNEQVLYVSGTGVAHWQTTHLHAVIRTFNSGATGTAVQVFVYGTSVLALDAPSPRTAREVASGMAQNAVTSPTTFLQLANFANSAEPASASLSNTAAGYSTLGGKFQFAAVAGAATDYALFGFQVPSPYTLYVSSIRISQLVVKSLTTGFTAPAIFAWGAAFNSSAVSLATAAPYSPMRVALGQQTVGGTAVATVGTVVGNDINWAPGTPIAVFSTRFLHIILQIPILAVAGTACVLYGHCAIDGWFE